MKRWKYMEALYRPWAESTGDYNEWGLEGWELVSVTRLDDDLTGERYNLFFKKELPNVAPQEAARQVEKYRRERDGGL